MMKNIIIGLLLVFSCTSLPAQSYDELIGQAMDAVEKDSLSQAESLFKKALKLEPGNMRNARFRRSIINALHGVIANQSMLLSL